jgi:hypothetical protein
MIHECRENLKEANMDKAERTQTVEVEIAPGAVEDRRAK